MDQSIQQNDNLTPDDKDLKSIRARRRFKALVRLIIDNLPWLTRKIKKSEIIQVFTKKMKEERIELKLRQKFLLLKPAEQRTENEKNQLRRLIGNLKCFQKFPSNVKQEFPAFMYFCYYGPNRLLVKQDSIAEKLYALISGEIIITQTNWDPILKENITSDIGTFGSGYIFGENNFLYETTREFTVTTETGCEFVYLHKNDYDKIVNDNVKPLWDEVKLNISWFDYFDNWSNNDIIDCCILSQKKKFETDQVVLSDETGNPDHVYFITKGFCYMLEQIFFKTENKDICQSNNEPNDHIRTRFIKICTFNRLACFNLGEDLKNRLIIAGTETECLLLPRYLLYSKALRTFKSVQHYLEITIPDHSKVVEKYFETVKYRKFKVKLIEKNLKRKNMVNPIHNVPYSIRLVDDVDFACSD